MKIFKTVKLDENSDCVIRYYAAKNKSQVKKMLVTPVLAIMPEKISDPSTFWETLSIEEQMQFIIEMLNEIKEKGE